MNRIPSIEILDKIISAGLRPPRMLKLMITNGCNLQCQHCWRDSRPRDKSFPVPANILKRLISEFVQLGVERIHLTGGEPLTHPDWYDLVKYSCAQPGVEEVCIQTNATLLTEIEVNALTSLKYEGLSIQVSLDGGTAQSHDQVRGSGSFEKTLRSLNILADAGLGKQTTIAFTEMRHNFHELPGLFNLLHSIGISHLISGTLVSKGRAGLTNALHTPLPSQYRSLLDYYHENSSFRGMYEAMGNIVAVEWYKGMLCSESKGCTFIEKPYIMTNGVMYPCEMLPVDEFSVSGIYQRPVKDCMEEFLSIVTGLQKISRQRIKYLEDCGDCSGKLHCGGGCMGRAHACYGKFMAVEDRCALRKAVYTWKPGTEVAS
jgi:radical SAM protein with 4Fe4S-binding SPASM domain